MKLLALSICVGFTAAGGPPAGFEAAWRQAAAKFAAKIQPSMSVANQLELQQGLATTDPSPPFAVRQAGPSTHPSVSANLAAESTVVCSFKCMMTVIKNVESRLSQQPYQPESNQ